MQETLAPAIELFGEDCFRDVDDSVGLGFSANEGVYGSSDATPDKSAPFLTQEAVRLAQDVAAGLRPQAEFGVSAGSRSVRLLMRGVAAAVVALLASVVLFGFTNDSHESMTSFRADSANCWWHDSELRKTDNSTAEATILGCLGCHNSKIQISEGEPKLRKSHSKVLACVSCHQGTISEQLKTIDIKTLDSDSLVGCLWPLPNG